MSFIQAAGMIIISWLRENDLWLAHYKIWLIFAALYKLFQIIENIIESYNKMFT